MSSDVRRQLFARYPTLASAQLPAYATKTILRSELIEVDRLWRNVDLVSFTNNAGDTEIAIFKYFTEIARARHHWAEHKLLLHLPPHPLLPRYTRTVLDENSGRVVGFCAEYFPGRNLQASPRVFKLSWLKQLIHLVDELNLTCGIVHADIWPANIMVNEATDEIKLLDFGGAQPLEQSMPAGPHVSGYDNALIDVQKLVTTVYRVITHKLPLPPQQDGDQRGPHIDHFWAEIPTWDWPQHPDTELDHNISEYQRLLSDWVATRQELAHGQPGRKRQKKMNHKWPCRAKLNEILTFDRALCCPPYRPPVGTAENPWVTWERPATKDLVPGVVMLANGKSRLKSSSLGWVAVGKKGALAEGSNAQDEGRGRRHASSIL